MRKEVLIFCLAFVACIALWGWASCRNELRVEQEKLACDEEVINK